MKIPKKEYPYIRAASLIAALLLHYLGNQPLGVSLIVGLLINIECNMRAIFLEKDENEIP